MGAGHCYGTRLIDGADHQPFCLRSALLVTGGATLAALVCCMSAISAALCERCTHAPCLCSARLPTASGNHDILGRAVSVEVVLVCNSARFWARLVALASVQYDAESRRHGGLRNKNRQNPCVWCDSALSG